MEDEPGEIVKARVVTSMAELGDKDISAIEDLHSRWIAEERRGDVQAMLDLCADDVMAMPPTAATRYGKASLAQLLESDDPIQDLSIVNLRVHGSGSVAYLTSNYSSHLGTNGGREFRGTRLWVLRKVGDEWRIAIMSWSVESG